jgi:hypothetical protein
MDPTVYDGSTQYQIEMVHTTVNKSIHFKIIFIRMEERGSTLRCQKDRMPIIVIFGDTGEIKKLFHAFLEGLENHSLGSTSDFYGLIL